MKADNNQLYKLYFNLDPRNNKSLAPGMDVNVFVYYNNNSNNSLTVPIEAVFNDSGISFVWVFNTESSTVNRRQVETAGLAGDGKIKITAGLNGNENVVVAGVNVLLENQKVEVLKPESETNIGGLL
jgi:multidrug efflux pump subunit AcrA (membrane-fusion protein)